MTNIGAGWGFDDALGRGRDLGDFDTRRKRKTYDRDIDLAERDRYGGRRFDRSGPLGLDRFFGAGDRYGAGGGLLTDRFGGGGMFERGRPFMDQFGFDLPLGFDRGFDMGGFGRGLDLGFPEELPSGFGRLALQQRPQAIGEAGFDMGLGPRRRVNENRYRRLRDWDRVEENPNIDDLTLWRPRADIFDQGVGGLRVEFEVPGVPKDDISLTVRDDTITLAALKPQTRKEEAGFHYQNERHFGKFYRRLTLPFAVDPDSVRAHLEQGVLKVHLNKAGGAERVPIGESVGITTGGPSTTSTSTGATKTRT